LFLSGGNYIIFNICILMKKFKRGDLRMKCPNCGNDMLTNAN
jgi:hypothetical protein